MAVKSSRRPLAGNWHEVQVAACKKRKRYYFKKWYVHNSWKLLLFIAFSKKVGTKVLSSFTRPQPCCFKLLFKIFFRYLLLLPHRSSSFWSEVICKEQLEDQQRKGPSRSSTYDVRHGTPAWMNVRERSPGKEKQEGTNVISVKS